MPTLAKVVNDNPTIEEDDLTLLFEKHLDAISQAWFVELGFLLGVAGPTVLYILEFATKPLTLASLFSLVPLFLFQAVLLILLYAVIKDTPVGRHEARLKDYLKARKLIREKLKTSGQTPPP